MEFDDLTIFEKNNPGSSPYSLDEPYFVEGINEEDLPSKFLRKNEISFPEISERELVKHYTKLSKRMFSVDENFYPLGSCTMKYNPKINEDIAQIDEFINLHPLQEEDDIQGTLSILYNLERELSYICGMDKFTLQPAAGAHGELTALFIARKYFESKDEKRIKVVVPDSSHGTNPATASFAGFNLVTIPSKDGEVDMEALKKECDSNLAVFMLTNPNTLGLFERNIMEISKLVHDAGGLTYLDGANFNALLGLVRPGDMNFDMMHLNLHKTFATPHGGGGPGSGPVGVKRFLEDFLPSPQIEKKDDIYFFTNNKNSTIGAVKAFYGNFNVILKASAYIDSLGLKGLKETSKIAIINANYIQEKLKDVFKLPYNKTCMHEFVITPDDSKTQLKTIDLAKRLLDFGIHAPTVYFPLIVKEAIMIEPTETETKQSMDNFIKVMKLIHNESINDINISHNAPQKLYRKRLDEVQAARKPILVFDEIS